MHRVDAIANRHAQRSCLRRGPRRGFPSAGVTEGGCNLAGVYFEKYVKGKHGQTLWIRNLQLSIYGVPLSILYTYFKDGRYASGAAPKIPTGIGCERPACPYTCKAWSPSTLPAMVAELCIQPP